MFRTQNNVPEIYVNGSRDFQLLCRLKDAMFGGVKYNIDSLKHTSNTMEMNNILLPKEIQYEEIKTEHGIFTSNTHLGLTAQEVYDKWLYDKENPSEPVPTLEELVKTLQEENKVLKEELTQIQTSIASLTSLITATLEEK